MPLGAARLSLLAYQATVAAGGRSTSTITVNGDAQVDTSRSKFGSASLLLDGTGDWISITDIPFNSQTEFTWECFFNVDVDAGGGTVNLISNRVGSYGAGDLMLLFRNYDMKLQLSSSGTGGMNLAPVSMSAISVDTWHHVALSRNSSGDWGLWFNGSRVGNGSGWTQTLDNDGVGIGAFPDGQIPANSGTDAWFDEVRISSVARYSPSSTSITVPTAAFQNDSDTLALLHMDGANGSTTFTDDTFTPVRPAVTLTGQDTQVKTDHEESKFGGLSVNMGSGSTDYILVDHTAQDIDYGDDFTYEFWFRTSSLPSLFYMFASGSTRGDYIALYNKSGTWTLAAPVSNGSTVYTQIRNIGSTPATNTWHHIALVKDGSNLNMFFNGTLLTVNNGSAGSMSSTYGWDGVNRIGAWATNTSYGFAGQLDEVRFSKSVRYTSSFTPSTSAFVNDSDTQLLVHFDEPTETTAFADDNTSIRVAQEISMPYGSGSFARMSTAQSQFGGSSAYFDGNNDVIGIGDSSDSNFVLLPKTGVFTWEMWVRAQDTTFQQISTVYGAYGDANPAGRTWIGIDGSNKWTFSGNGGPTIASSTNANNTTWTHLAVVRNSSNQFNFFVNGQSQGTSTNSYTIASGYVSIGANANSYGLDYEGYVDEFRISNTARYTGNFTPSTTPFVNDTDTLVLLHMDGINNARQTQDDNR